MDEKRLHIIKNVALMYLKFGIRSVTMDDVAAEFGISKKTLYQYFSDKADLVSNVVDYFLENPEMQFKSKESENAINNFFAIRDHLTHIFKIYNNNIEFDLKKTYPLLYKKVRETKRKRIFVHTMENLNHGIDNGYYRKDLDPYIISKLMVGRLLFTMNPDYEIFEEYEVNTVALFDSAMSYHMHAICTPKGLEYYKKQLNIVQNEDKN